jgi:hypothetical protein
VSDCTCPVESFSGMEVDESCPLHGFYDTAGKWIHPNDLSREALRELVGALSWMALDLAQHLNFANLQYQEGGRKGPEDDDAQGYIAAERMAYAISGFPYDGPAATEGIRKTPGIAIFDGQGGFS